MPEKLDRCVANVKAKGNVDNPWAVCNSSIGKSEIKEKVNENRHDPLVSPDIKKGKITPSNRKTTKGIGGEVPSKKIFDSILYKQIFDQKLRNDSRTKK